MNSMNYVSNILTAVRWVDQSAIDVDQLTLNWFHILMIILSISLQYGWSTRSHFYRMKRRMIESFLIGRDRFSLTEKIRTITWRRIRRWRQYFPIVNSSSRISTIFLDRVSTVPMESRESFNASIRRSKTFTRSYNRMIHVIDWCIL